MTRSKVGDISCMNTQSHYFIQHTPIRLRFFCGCLGSSGTGQTYHGPTPRNSEEWGQSRQRGSRCAFPFVSEPGSLQVPCRGPVGRGVHVSQGTRREIGRITCRLRGALERSPEISLLLVFCPYPVMCVRLTDRRALSVHTIDIAYSLGSTMLKAQKSSPGRRGKSARRPG